MRLDSSLLHSCPFVSLVIGLSRTLDHSSNAFALASNHATKQSCNFLLLSLALSLAPSLPLSPFLFQSSVRSFARFLCVLSSFSVLAFFSFNFSFSFLTLCDFQRPGHSAQVNCQTGERALGWQQDASPIKHGSQPMAERVATATATQQHGDSWPVWKPPYRLKGRTQEAS